MTKFHNKGGSYTFEEMEADALKRKAAADAKKPAAAKPADAAPKADVPAPFGKPAN